MPLAEGLGTEELVKAYLRAKREVVDDGFDYELAWLLQAGQGPITQERFVREAAWVILSTGMSESVVRRLFPAIEAACHGFDLRWVASGRYEVRVECLASFGHARKIDAILDIAEVAGSLGDAGLAECLEEPERFLRSLPYVGPVTWRHLAKNLGVPVAKADRHLVRFAAAAGRESVDLLCAEISDMLGEPVSMVDTVLWRWSVIHSRGCRGRQHSAVDCLRRAAGSRGGLVPHAS